MSLGSLCLAIFLMIFGLTMVFGLNFQYHDVVEGGAAIIAALGVAFGSGVIIWRRAA